MNPQPEDVLTIAPPPFSIIDGKNPWHIRYVLVRLKRTWASQSAGGMSATFMSCAPPTTLIRMAGAPSWPITSLTSALTCSSEVTSTCAARTDPGPELAPAIRSSADPSMSTAITRWPRSARRRTQAWPMPDPAAANTATADSPEGRLLAVDVPFVDGNGLRIQQPGGWLHPGLALVTRRVRHTG